MKDKPNCDLRQVVLLRHGESVWNKENLFTGWTDVDLSDRGREEGQDAGRGRCCCGLKEFSAIGFHLGPRDQAPGMPSDSLRVEGVVLLT